MTGILWDKEEDEKAMNWDETRPEIFGDIVRIKDLGCHCNPGHMCGGCVDIYKEFPIGPNERYFWKTEKTQRQGG